MLIGILLTWSVRKEQQEQQWITVYSSRWTRNVGCAGAGHPHAVLGVYIYIYTYMYI